MRLADIAAGAAALAAADRPIESTEAVGTLAPGELVMREPDEAWIEQQECALYFALCCAGSSRIAMGKTEAWTHEYATAQREHDKAIEDAKRVARKLTDAGRDLTPLLTHMAEREGLLV